MIKEKVKEHLLSNIKNEIEQLTKISKNSQSYANSASVKSDGKYDTRGIEAGYLAGAQAKRVEELKLEEKLVEEIELKEFTNNDEIVIGALVEIEFNQMIKKYFISTTAGGTMINIDGEVILVISVFSPIGAEVVGLKVGDGFELEVKKQVRNYQIKSVL